MDKAEQFEALRPRLFALAYRMMGSGADAEDIVQEAFLRWREAPDDIRSPQSYLMTIVSRLAVDALRSAQRKREHYVGVWLPEPLAATEAAHDPVELAESVSTAFLFVLEALKPAERVAFLLRDVFGSGYDEIASALDTTEANARQLTTRARKRMEDRRPRYAVRREQHEAALQQFFGAVVAGDYQRLVQLLRDDAVSYSDGGGKAAAAINPIRGADHIARFFLGVRSKAPEGADWRVVPTAGTPTAWLEVQGKLDSIVSMDLHDDGRIAAIFVQRNPDKLVPVAGDAYRKYHS